MKNKIIEDIKSAMKSQDKVALAVVRMLKSDIQMAELNKKSELTDDEIVSIVSKQIKMRKDSIKEFEKGNRNDLIEQSEQEIKILEKYLPEQVTEEEVTDIINNVFSKVNPTSYSDMGKIMGALTPLVKGKADMGIVSKIVKEKSVDKWIVKLPGQFKFILIWQLNYFSFEKDNIITRVPMFCDVDMGTEKTNIHVCLYSGTERNHTSILHGLSFQ